MPLTYAEELQGREDDSDIEVVASEGVRDLQIAKSNQSEKDMPESDSRMKAQLRGREGW